MATMITTLVASSRRCLNLCFFLWLFFTACRADTGTDELVVSQSFTLSATIVKGCLIGGGASDVASLGTLNFGSLSSLSSAVQATSSQGAGSIIVKCTPNVALTLSIDKGVNGSSSIASGRVLRQENGSATLSYQLYKDSGFSQIWGDGANGGSVQTLTATGSVQEIKIYARLFAAAALPPADRYSDTVVVTFSY
jgi:spore coat protein U-like protein